jgi:hypothetical protein
MNGVWGEDLKLAHVNGVWVQAIRLTRHIIGYGVGGYGKGGYGGSSKEDVSYPWIDPSFPRNNGKIDW